MNTLNDTEMMEVQGGVSGGMWGSLIGAYAGLLNKIEQNPNDYTWTMDWYYSK